MAKFVQTSEKSHWYTPAGDVAHDQPYAASSVKKNPELADKRTPTTVKHARKLGLYPSVTNILGVVAKDSLVDWKMEQVLLRAAAYPFKSTALAAKYGSGSEAYTEHLKKWIHTTIEGAFEKVSEAADHGELLHDAAETYLSSWSSPERQVPNDPRINVSWPRVQETLDAHVDSVERTEFTVVGDGYAGRLDFLGRYHEPEGWKDDVPFQHDRITDFKSREWPKNRKPSIYETDLIQIGGYILAARQLQDGHQNLGATSFFIHRKEPRVWLHHWTVADCDRAIEMFQLCYELWTRLKKHDPRRS